MTRDKARLETRGPWQVRGRLVVFTDSQGTLRSLRQAAVDLEASHSATLEAKKPQKQPRQAPSHEGERPKELGSRLLRAKQPARRQAVFVLTDADVGHVTDPAPADAGTDKAAAPSPEVILYSTSWCSFCRKTRQLLRSLDVPFVEKDIEKSAAAHREYRSKARGYDGVPLLDIGGNLVRGFDRDQILLALRRIQ